MNDEQKINREQELDALDIELQRPRVNPVSPAPAMNPAPPVNSIESLNDALKSIKQEDPNATKKPVAPIFTGHNLNEQKARITIPQKPKVEPVIEIPKVPVNSYMRTYEGDVADVLSNKKTSASSIALAESRRKQGEDSIGSAPEKSQTPKKLLIALVSLILLGGGGLGGYYLYTISPLAPVKTIAQTTIETPKTSIPVNTYSSISIDNKSLNQIISDIRSEVNKSQTANTLKEIALTKTKDAKKYRVSLEEMVKIMGIHPPDTLVRSVSTSPMLGVYANSEGVKSVFVVATVNYYQNAFAGLLQWENSMPDDLKTYLYQYSPQGITTAPLLPFMPSTYTATSTATTKTATTSTKNATTTLIYPDPVIPPYTIIHGTFVDRIIKNKDVREFVTTDKKILFLYSFIDNTKLVITDAEGTLSAILNRLEQQAFVR